MGQVVVVELKPRTATFSQPVGMISEILGENMAKGMEVEIAIRNHDIPHVFPDAVLKQVSKLSEEVPEEAKSGRIDLRHLPLVTIDGEDARDFDDAVFARKNVEAVGNCGSPLPMSATMFVYVLPLIPKHMRVETRYISQIVLFLCYRKSSPMDFVH